MKTKLRWACLVTSTGLAGATALLWISKTGGVAFHEAVGAAGGHADPGAYLVLLIGISLGAFCGLSIVSRKDEATKSKKEETKKATKKVTKKFVKQVAKKVAQEEAKKEAASEGSDKPPKEVEIDIAASLADELEAEYPPDGDQAESKNPGDESKNPGDNEAKKPSVAPKPQEKPPGSNLSRIIRGVVAGIAVVAAIVVAVIFVFGDKGAPPPAAARKDAKLGKAAITVPKAPKMQQAAAEKAPQVQQAAAKKAPQVQQASAKKAPQVQQAAAKKAPQVSSPPPSEAREEQAKKHNDQGMKALGAKNYPQAVSEFTSALASDPAFQQARLNLACTYALSGEEDRAMDVVQQLRAANCEACSEPLAKAEADKGSGVARNLPPVKQTVATKPQGQKKADDAQSQKPSASPAPKADGAVAAAKDQGKQPSASPGQKAAEPAGAAKEKGSREISGLVASAAKADMDFEDKDGGWTWYDKCNFHLKAKRLPQALYACQQGLDISANEKVEAALLFTMGRICEQVDNNDEAIGFYERALQARPGYKDAKRRLSRLK